MNIPFGDYENDIVDLQRDPNLRPGASEATEGDSLFKIL